MKTTRTAEELNAASYNEFGRGHLPALIGLEIVAVTPALKANFVGTAREGAIECHASPLHLGRTTQVWDAEVSSPQGRIALFRCTQMILWPKP